MQKSGRNASVQQPCGASTAGRCRRSTRKSAQTASPALLTGCPAPMHAQRTAPTPHPQQRRQQAQLLVVAAHGVGQVAHILPRIQLHELSRQPRPPLALPLGAAGATAGARRTGLLRRLRWEGQGGENLERKGWLKSLWTQLQRLCPASLIILNTRSSKGKQCTPGRCW